jgi:hypothetical protein
MLGCSAIKFLTDFPGNSRGHPLPFIPLLAFPGQMDYLLLPNCQAMAITIIIIIINIIQFLILFLRQSLQEKTTPLSFVSL